jgi:hypothetical protein
MAKAMTTADHLDVVEQLRQAHINNKAGRYTDAWYRTYHAWMGYNIPKAQMNRSLDRQTRGVMPTSSIGLGLHGKGKTPQERKHIALATRNQRYVNRLAKGH